MPDASQTPEPVIPEPSAKPGLPRRLVRDALGFWIRHRFAGVPSIAVEALRAHGVPPRDLLLLDARTPEEFAVSHLPGARNAPDRETALRLARASAGRPVVVYCSVGWRSAALAERLIDAGVADVRNLEGSLFDWANRGLPVVRRGRPVRQVHPYDRLWGLLLRRDLRAWGPGDRGSEPPA